MPRIPNNKLTLFSYDIYYSPKWELEDRPKKLGEIENMLRRWINSGRN